MAMVPKVSIFDCVKAGLRPSTILVWLLLCEVRDRRLKDTYLELSTAKKAGIQKTAYYFAFEQLSKKGWIEFSRKVNSKTYWKIIKGFVIEEPIIEKPTDSIFTDIYFEFYPDQYLSSFQKTLINNQVTNEEIWRETLTFWKGNDYKAKNIVTILKKYAELSEFPTEPKKIPTDVTPVEDIEEMSENEQIQNHFSFLKDFLQLVELNSKNGIKSILTDCINKLNSYNAENFEETERWLIDLQDSLVNQLITHSQKDELTFIERRVGLKMKEYKNMSKTEYQNTFEILLQKEFRESLNIPNFSLFG